MKKRLIILWIVFAWTFSIIQAQEHFISDTSYFLQVQEDFEKKQIELPNGDLFEILKRKDLSAYEREALTFLYAYLPESDIVDKSGDYFLENVRMTRKAVQEMPWGKLLDESLIRHFVMPVRVNNEPLDDSRKVFYEELKDRVRNLSLEDAIIAVNHWCHENVIYTPSDARTSSPLQTVRTAYGRCGEESTFCVAALRSVGIPARQVYTPRWAHTDDNHAWVEAWANGKWHFLGACEPEPVLDLAWFNAPASRSMLMHTKVFGYYQGKEEVIIHKTNYTEINVTENYAPTSRMDVLVMDDKGKPVPNAKVEFKVYNYAEFYTVATKYTDERGKTYLTGGLGDMMAWVSKDGKWGYEKLSFAKEKNKVIYLNRSKFENYEENFDIIPPSENFTEPAVSSEQRVNNTKLMEQEDAVRNAYVATMYTHEKAIQWCLDNNKDTVVIARMLEQSRGNHTSILGFLSQAKDKQLAVKLLQTLSQKDLRDAPQDVLLSQLNHSVLRTEVCEEDFVNYVLCPRIELEALTTYKAYFQQNLSLQQKKEWSNPLALVRWIQENLMIKEDLNVTSIPVSPAGVWSSRVADVRSRNIFFVAVLRSLGIPARIDPVTNQPQYLKEREWQNGDFEMGSLVDREKGTLYASYESSKENQNPKYYTHFTISKFDKGVFKLLNFEEGDNDMGGGIDYENMLKNGQLLEAGYYLMTSGNRQTDGSVMTHMVFFNVKPKEDTHIELQLRKRPEVLEVLGQIKSNLSFEPLTMENNKIVSRKQSAENVSAIAKDGWCVCGILGVNEEPSNHVLRDLATAKSDLEAAGIPILLLFPDKDSLSKFRVQDFAGLPANIIWGIDKENTIQQSLMKGTNLMNGNQLPMIALVHTDGRIVYVSQGYTIGLGEQLNKVLQSL